MIHYLYQNRPLEDKCTRKDYLHNVIFMIQYNRVLYNNNNNNILLLSMILQYNRMIIMVYTQLQRLIRIADLYILFIPARMSICLKLYRHLGTSPDNRFEKRLMVLPVDILQKESSPRLPLIRLKDRLKVVKLEVFWILFGRGPCSRLEDAYNSCNESEISPRLPYKSLLPTLSNIRCGIKSRQVGIEYVNITGL